jgi:hypothetical protein
MDRKSRRVPVIVFMCMTYSDLDAARVERCYDYVLDQAFRPIVMILPVVRTKCHTRYRVHQCVFTDDDIRFVTIP